MNNVSKSKITIPAGIIAKKTDHIPAEVVFGDFISFWASHAIISVACLYAKLMHQSRDSMIMHYFDLDMVVIYGRY